MFDNFPPSGQKEASVAGATLDLTQLLPKLRGYYTFEGSLTTPPCSEHVRWFVLKQAMQASSGEIVLFAARYPAQRASHAAAEWPHGGGDAGLAASGALRRRQRRFLMST